jgi:chaperone modulatory protein CbpM
MELRQVMSNEPQEVTFWRTEYTMVTLGDLADAAGLRPKVVERFVEHGLIEPIAVEGSHPLFAISTIERLRRIMRLRRDPGVNVAGAAVILDMRERMEQIQKELQALRRRFGI